MSFLTGKNKELASSDITGIRKQIADFISQQGLGTVLSGAGSMTDLTPFQELFAQRRREAVGQAKESVGSLTGSGLGNAIGTAAGRSVAEENAFLADLLNRNRQASAQRFLSLIGALPGFQGQYARQPGFLDYLFKGLSRISGGGGSQAYTSRSATPGVGEGGEGYE